MEELKANGATVNVPDKSREDTINSAINMLKIRKMIIRYDGLLKADPDMLDVLSYYANSISQWRQARDIKVPGVPEIMEAQEEIKDVSLLKKRSVPAPQ